MYPSLITKTIESFKKLPGIGEKTAERLALSLLEVNIDDVKDFSENILNMKHNIIKCSICGHISDTSICDICNNQFRDDQIICVVEDYKSVFMFEKTGNFSGKYHVLSGLISPIDGIIPDDLNINSLIERVDTLLTHNKDVELILALKPSIEGETTTMYLKKIFENKKVKISRLSYGIPMGVEIDYLDSITLDRALQDRKDI